MHTRKDDTGHPVHIINMDIVVRRIENRGDSRSMKASSLPTQYDKGELLEHRERGVYLYFRFLTIRTTRRRRRSVRGSSANWLIMWVIHGVVF